MVQTVIISHCAVVWCAVGRVGPVGHGQGNWVDIGGGQQPGTSSQAALLLLPVIKDGFNCSQE